MPSIIKALLFALIVGFLGVIAGLLPQTLALEESFGLQLLFQLRGPRSAPPDVVVVALDRLSSKSMNLPMEPRKWPRTVHARLIDRLARAGAAVVVFDLIFNEPQSDEIDRTLAHAIRRAGNVVLAQSLVDESLPVLNPQGGLTANINIEKIVPPIPLLAEAALALAPFPVPKVPIKLNRVWTFKPGAGDIPTMPVMAFHIYAFDAFARLGTLIGETAHDAFIVSAPVTKDSFAGEEGLGTIHAMHTVFQQQHLPMGLLKDAVNRISEPNATRLRSLLHLYRNNTSRYVDFYGPAESIRTISYHRLMGADEDLEAFDLRGKAIFVGQTESYWPRAMDGFYTAYSSEDAVDVSGVEIAATVFANLVEDRAITPLASSSQLALIFLWGVFIAVISHRLSAATAGMGVAGSVAGYLVIACALFNAYGTWFPVVLPLFVMTPLIYFAALIWKYRVVSQERRIIRKAFGYYLPDAVVDQLSHNLQAIQSDRKVVYSICLFTDAEKYTNLSESLDPETLTALMNQYYQAIFKPIREHGGVVLQVIGDSVLSLWTGPKRDVELKRKACMAALAVAEAVDQFNGSGGEHQLPTRIGLHAGEVVLGNIGAMDHFEYRPVGDIVNTASRLEGLNKYLQTRILTSADIIDQLEGFETRCMGRFLFLGKSKPVEVHELRAFVDALDDSDSEAWHSFAQGLQAFAQGLWEQARAAFVRCMDIGGPDGPSEYYIRLCEAYKRTPPAEDWDGTVSLSRK